VLAAKKIHAVTDLLPQLVVVQEEVLDQMTTTLLPAEHFVSAGHKNTPQGGQKIIVLCL
jgi:hypothetical protein